MGLAPPRVALPIFINGRFGSQSVTGVQRVARQLLRGLDRELGGNPEIAERLSVQVLAPRNASCLPVLEHIRVRSVGRLAGHAWEQLELPRHARAGVLLNFANTAPLMQRNELVMIHDASIFAVPETYTPAFRWWYRALLPRLGIRARRVLTVSAFSRDELSRRAGIPVSKIDVIHLGAEHILEAAPDLSVFKRVPVRRGEYVLTVGSRSPHKNVGAVMRAVAVMNGTRPDVVSVGAGDPRVFTDSGGPLPTRMHATGYVSDGELRALYEHALCLVYPSLYEGFGLPALEAMVCGCPAVVSNAASLPEICGDAVLYCDASDHRDIAAKISLLQNPARRNELRARGFQRTQRFTWPSASRTLLDILESLRAT
jgi:glycosyltransferase involved in cell wall biosynthesis